MSSMPSWYAFFFLPSSLSLCFFISLIFLSRTITLYPTHPPIQVRSVLLRHPKPLRRRAWPLRRCPIFSQPKSNPAPPHRIVVGGLSQGAALAVLTGLTTERTLGGVFALSGYTPLRGKAVFLPKYVACPENNNGIGFIYLFCREGVQICKPLFPFIPFFFAQGTADRQVGHDFARDDAQTFA